MIFRDFWIILLIPVIGVLFFLSDKKHRGATVRVPSTRWFKNIKRSRKARLSRSVPIVRFLSLIFIVLALARPQQPLQETKLITEGIDIVLAIDASGSMAAEDFKMGNKRVNRLRVVKDVVKDFIEERKNDRIGLVAFAGLAYTVCPLTTDHNWLVKNLERISLGTMEDGTAVGSAIMSSLTRLENSKAESKVIILLTDGRSNAGEISPIDAANAARAMNVKIYTIGAGSKGLVPFPARDLWGRTVYQNVEIDLDEESLKEIARRTNARYFRASDTNSLREIYQAIDKMEKTKIEETGFREFKELFPNFLFIGICLLLFELIMANTLLLRIP